MMEQLKKNDIKEYVSLLSHLSISEYSPYLNLVYDNLELNNKFILVYKKDGKIVGTGSIYIEPKLSHSGSPVAHIEDVVVLPDYRQLGIGESIIKELLDIAREKLCYKVVLSCKEYNIHFYKKCGFSVNEASMRMDL